MLPFAFLLVAEINWNPPLLYMLPPEALGSTGRPTASITTFYTKASKGGGQRCPGTVTPGLATARWCSQRGRALGSAHSQAEGGTGHHHQAASHSGVDVQDLGRFWAQTNHFSKGQNCTVDASTAGSEGSRHLTAPAAEPCALALRVAALSSPGITTTSASVTQG